MQMCSISHFNVLVRPIYSVLSNLYGVSTVWWYCGRDDFRLFIQNDYFTDAVQCTLSKATRLPVLSVVT